MKTQLLLIALFITTQIYAQQLAVLKPHLDSIAIKEHNSMSSPPIGSISAGQFVLCHPSDSSFWRVDNMLGIKGIASVENLLLVKDLGDIEKKILIIHALKTFSEFIAFADTFPKKISHSKKASKWSRHFYYEVKIYHCFVELLAEQFCDTADEDLLHAFIQMLGFHEVNDINSHVLSKCYLCHPNIVFEKIINSKYKEMLTNQLTIGLQSIIQIDKYNIDNYTIAGY